MVYTMLMESDQISDQRTDQKSSRSTTDFKDTDLFKECVAAGVIPDPSGKNQISNPNTEDQGFKTPNDPDTPDNLLTLNFQIHDMWCPACAWVLEKALLRSNGIVKASCNFSSDRGNVLYDPIKTSPDRIFTIMHKLGYTATLFDDRPQKKTREFIRLFTTLFLTMNVMMLSWAIYSGFFIELSTHAVQMLAWPVYLMASIVVFYGGYPIHKRAITGIRSGRPGMETLITTGSLSTYFFSLFQLFTGSLHLYFDAASMLILLTLTGKMLEQSAKTKIAHGLWEFFSLVPQKVRICTDQFSKGRYVSIKQLAKGDAFMAEQGEIMAADGIVLKGQAVIDESSITGEAKPVTALQGDKVKSGTRVTSGTIQIKAVKVGDDSILGRMLLIMENSLSGKTAQTQRFETLLKFFVPGIIGLSGLVFFFWFMSGLSSYDAFNRAISVLVISCPCALGIAIPLALVAGVSAAGKKGILVRDFEAFEKVSGIDTIVFDKTGTLTTGRLVVLSMDTSNNFSSQKAWQIIHTMEQGSDHYIANTIKEYGINQNITPIDLKNIQYHSNGITSYFKDIKYNFGSMNFINQDNPLPSFISPPQQGAQVISTIFLSENDKIVAAVHLGDSMKNGVTSLVSELKKKGLSSFLISGDGEKPTMAAGKFVNIPVDATHGSMLPHEKADFIKGLKQSGKKTAMVGDGLNDAPAMAQSDLAIAVQSGLTPKKGVAAITLMQETPVQFLVFLNLANRVNRKVKQNLIFAFIYNLISIPVAACGLLNPIVAAIAMLLSSLSVTFNTLRLVQRESKKDSIKI